MTVPRWRRALLPGSVVIAVGALLVGAIVAPGFDAQRTPVDGGAVWALQSGDAFRYARVNVDLGEIDTVKDVREPSALVDGPRGALLFAAGFARVTRLDPALPLNLDDLDLLEEAPAGTVDVRSAGGFTVVRTEDGGAWIVEPTEELALRRVLSGDTDADGNPIPWKVVALDVDAQGRVVGLSEDGVVGVVDPGASEVSSEWSLPASSRPEGEAEVALVAGRWAVWDPAASQVVVQGREGDPVAVAVRGDAVLQASSVAGDGVLLADAEGLWRIAGDGSEPALVAAATVGAGRAARVVEHAGERWAAWLGTAGGELWRESRADLAELDFAGDTLASDPADRRPVLRSSGRVAILNDEVSGWVWTLPDGALVPSSQDWKGAEQENAPDDEEQAAVAVDPKPPVAHDDRFGVRPGSVVVLPVLLNDSDPNGDSLSVDPASLAQPGPIGRVSTASDDQVVVIEVAPEARPGATATFSYRAEDGTASSPPATVRLEVVAPTANRAPVWCADYDDRCRLPRPSAQLTPGGSVRVDALSGWIDPDGDPLLIGDVRSSAAVVQAAAVDATHLLVRHVDAAASGGSATVDAAVSDVRGASTAQSIPVTASPSAPIAVEDAVVVGIAGRPLTIPLADRMSGGQGELRVLPTANLRSGRAMDVRVDPAAAELTVAADRAGSYVVQWTAVDESGAEANGLIRVVLRSADAAPLTVAPLVAFVRPAQDAVVAVADAVSDPGGRVLLVSGVMPEPAAPLPGDPSGSRAELFAAAAGDGLIRVAGSTASGGPGLVGSVRFTVSDGAGTPLGTARGSLVVYLLPEAPRIPPIARDDRVVVRVGERVDVDVLANDVAVLGSTAVLDPAGVIVEDGADVEGFLAFAGSDRVRVVAPSRPGLYTVRYTVYSSGYPTATATALVTVDVRSGSENTPPVAPTLVGRVASGGTVAISLPTEPLDPVDGDAVGFAAVPEPPAHGAAYVSADGRSIVYSSSSGFTGEDTFPYVVRDSRGAEATGVVRVGVGAPLSDARPLAYTDVVDVEVGSGSVVVQPLLNDSDPLGRALTLDPDVQSVLDPSDTANRAYADARLLGVTDGAVEFDAGDRVGAFAYTYSVDAGASGRAKGTILLRVLSESSPDAPRVRDTILTAETRTAFSRGVDVVAGQTEWARGSVGDLTLSLWGNPGADVQVSGHRIRGTLTDDRRVVAFTLSGTGRDGVPVETHGFLVVPAIADLHPVVRPDSAGGVAAKERETTSLGVADLVLAAPGLDVEVAAGESVASGQRPGARCVGLADGDVGYESDEGSPWRDYCLVPVRYSGQSTWTRLPIPIAVTPGDPQPELAPGALEVSPGETIVYDLGPGMTTWLGAEQDDASYAISGGASAFEIVQDGQRLEITGGGRSRPGTVQQIEVRITNYDDVLPATLTLTVGPAPKQLPVGGYVEWSCSVRGDGSGCSIPVIGSAAVGQVNPISNAPLELVGVGTPSCGVSMAAAGSAIRVSWTDATPGAAECIATFEVRDGQGRVGQGTVDLEFEGLPSADFGVSWEAYGPDFVVLRATPYPGYSAYPALESFRVVGNGATTTCQPDVPCEVAGLTSRDRVAFQVRARNAQGDSPTAVPVTAWALAAPEAPTVVASPARPADDAAALSWTLGLVDVEATPGANTDRVEFRLGSLSGTVVTPSPGPGSAVRLNVAAATATLVAVPIQSDVPPGVQCRTASRAVCNPADYVWQGTVQSFGAPESPTVSSSRVGPGDVLLTGTASAAAGALEWAFQTVGSASDSAACPASGSPAWGAASQNLALADNAIAYVSACSRVVDGGVAYGVRAAPTVTVVNFVDPGAPSVDAASGYGIATTATSGLTWSTVQEPSITVPASFVVEYSVGSAVAYSVADLAGSLPGTVSARFCLDAARSTCSADSVVVPVRTDFFSRTLVLTPPACAADGSVVAAPTGFSAAVTGSTPTTGGADFVVTVTETATSTTGTGSFTQAACPADP